MMSTTIQWIDAIERPISTDDGQVIGYHKDWVNENNPKGTRIGFITVEGQFVSANFSNYTDFYDISYSYDFPSHYFIIPNTHF